MGSHLLVHGKLIGYTYFYSTITDSSKYVCPIQLKFSKVLAKISLLEFSWYSNTLYVASIQRSFLNYSSDHLASWPLLCNGMLIPCNGVTPHSCQTTSRMDRRTDRFLSLPDEKLINDFRPSEKDCQDMRERGRADGSEAWHASLMLRWALPSTFHFILHLGSCNFLNPIQCVRRTTS